MFATTTVERAHAAQRQDDLKRHGAAEVKERFTELVAGGMAPNAAAPQALKDVQQRLRAKA